MHNEPNVTGPIALPDDAAALAGHVRRNPSVPYVNDHAPDLGAEEQRAALESLNPRRDDGSPLVPLVWLVMAVIVSAGIAWAGWRFGLQGMAVAVVLVVFVALAFAALDD